MWKEVLRALWRGVPKGWRRWGVLLTESRFTVTAGAVVADEQGRVLLLEHAFRAGSGWGIPGGFINPEEQPEEALRRELREEVGLELESLDLAFVRTLKTVNQVEVIFRGRARGRPEPRSREVTAAEWFPPDALPPGLSRDQRQLIARALNHRAR
jgi:ADP-ribose pyrophosphatase YjhB (NUDIX family)